MAQTFIEVFGDSLISAPVDKNESALPSPEKLKRKFILKHKKLPDGVADETTKIIMSVESSENVHGMDIANSVQSGILHLQDQDDLEWRPHFFVLTRSNIVYSEVKSQQEADDGEDDQHGGGGGGSSLHPSSRSTSFSGPSGRNSVAGKASLSAPKG